MRPNVLQTGVFIASVFMLFLTGCGTKEKFVMLSEEVVPKTVDISVFGVAKRPIFVVDGDKFVVKEVTATVRVGGSGVFVSPNNHVLTCQHLFWPEKITSIIICKDDGECTFGEILHQEHKLDLALLQANFDNPTPYARIADPRTLKVGQEVLAVGSPLGLAFSVSQGIISALHRDVGVHNMTQSDAFLNPGNSGGPLFNLKGEIVGINSRIMPPRPGVFFTGVGFSVQSGQIVEFLTRVRNKHKVLGEGLPRFKMEYWEAVLVMFGFTVD